MLRLQSRLCILLALSCVAAAVDGIAADAPKLAPSVDKKKLDIQIQVPAALLPKSSAPAESASGAEGVPSSDAKSQQGAGDKTTSPPPEPIAKEWPAAEIVVAEARCKTILKDLDALAVPEPPFRLGACGAPAPVRLISIGKNPEVSLDPPPVLTCDMVAKLSEWLKSSVQPSAIKNLGAPIIKIGSMSDYSCRAAYGRKGGRLSEHGRANALDIRGFVTAKGSSAIVLADWGMTQRDVARAIAAAKAAEEKRKKEAAAEAAIKKASAPAASDPPASSVKPHETASTRTAEPTGPAPSAAKGVGFAPGYLGGPTPAEAAVKPGTGSEEPKIVPRPISKTGLFLREVHASACKIFGTTLGPEANEAHRNHFHIDMAERKNGLKICE